LVCCVVGCRRVAVGSLCVVSFGLCKLAVEVMAVSHAVQCIGHLRFAAAFLCGEVTFKGVYSQTVLLLFEIGVAQVVPPHGEILICRCGMLCELTEISGSLLVVTHPVIGFPTPEPGIVSCFGIIIAGTDAVIEVLYCLVHVAVDELLGAQLE